MVFTGITEREIQGNINNSEVNQRVKGKFDNKSELKPVTAKKIWERIQIDLMSMTDVPVDVEGERYQWMHRHLFPLPRTEASSLKRYSSCLQASVTNIC